MPEATPLTDAQLKELAGAVIDTKKNIYREAEAKFGGHDLTDEEWERMCKQEKMFRCEECNLWQGDAVRVAPGVDICCECSPEDSD